jgi:hypothetical protein
MLNYKSVRSSEPQIRSNPALRRIGDSSGFQKRLSTLLEPISLPFPTFQIAKEGSEFALSQFTHYAWVRPAHLRSQKIVLVDGMPLLLLDTRDSSKMFSLRIPFDKKSVQHSGPIVLEGAWDAQDHVLWIWDVLVWEKQTIWNISSYSKRWELLKRIVSEIMDCGHPMSDAEVKLPTWESLSKVIARQELDPSTSIEFQPEKAGQRRHVFLIQDQGVKFVPKTHHERKQIANEIQDEKPDKRPKPVRSQSTMPIHKPIPTPVQTPIPTPVQTQVQKPIRSQSTMPIHKPISQDNKEKHTIARLSKDTIYKLPDTYRLKSVTEDAEDLGIAAIRNIETSKRLRELIKNQSSILVDIQWVEPFQKYEIKKIHTTP